MLSNEILVEDQDDLNEWHQMFQVPDARTAGGIGSGNYGHSGRPGAVGGSGKGRGVQDVEGEGGEAFADMQAKSQKMLDFAKRLGPQSQQGPLDTDEQRHQQSLAEAQTNPLAHPLFVIGEANNVAGQRYIAAYGEEFTPQSLPSQYKRGEMKECYKNASLLVMANRDLDFVEGIAYSNDMPFMHAWAVDKAGRVVDPTWEHPEKCQYFGVKYDRSKYLKYLYKAKIYGVLSSTQKNAEKAVDTGGSALR